MTGVTIGHGDAVVGEEIQTELELPGHHPLGDVGEAAMFRGLFSWALTGIIADKT